MENMTINDSLEQIKEFQIKVIQLKTTIRATTSFLIGNNSEVISKEKYKEQCEDFFKTLINYCNELDNFTQK